MSQLLSKICQLKKALLNLYNKLLADKKGLEVLIQTYFGDVRDVYNDLVNLPVDGIGLDFVEGKKTLELVKGGSADKTLYAGIVNGKNIWRNNYEKSLEILDQVPAEKVVLTTSYSLLHERRLQLLMKNLDSYFGPLRLLRLKSGWCVTWMPSEMVKGAEALANKNSSQPNVSEQMLNSCFRIAALTEADYTRLPTFAERGKESFKLLALPTTHIGSFHSNERSSC